MKYQLEFRGKWTDIIGPILLMALVSGITLGIAFPWMWVAYRKRVMNLSFYKGQPLDYDGSGGDYFVELIIVGLLSLVTLGFYAMLGFAQARLLRFDASHTLFPGGKRMQFRAGGIDLFGQYLLIGLLSAITFGIYGFWGYTRMRRFVLEHCFLDDMPLTFTGTGGQFFGHCLVIALLTGITLGIYSFLCAGTARILKWDVNNTVVPDI